jgi:hypothetical protein
LNLYNVQGQSCFEQHLLVDNEYWRNIESSSIVQGSSVIFLSDI